MLNRKRELFCQFLAHDPRLTATEAAQNAGYRVGRGRRAVASRLLTMVDVRERIAELRAAQIARLQADADEVLVGLSRIARFDFRQVCDARGDILPIADWPQDAVLAVASVDVEVRREANGKDAEGVTQYATVTTKKVRTNDRIRALELLARHYNLFAAEQKAAADGFGEKIAQIIALVQQESGGVAGILRKKAPTEAPPCH